MNREEKRKIAKEIMKLEKKYQASQDPEIEKDIQALIANLSLEDLLALDSYIVEKYENF